MNNMEIAEITDSILSDDYEEGEILDEDTLYDNVSSLEEFSGSDTDIKSNCIESDSSVLVKKLSSVGRKEKHHRRKEHKCKENSICRKERRGKHCYARIRKNKTVEVSEKSKVVDLIVTHSNETQNHKKKNHVILSTVHDGASKYNTNRRLPIHKDVPEKENRYSHRHNRHDNNQKSPPHRIDKKKCSEKVKKYLVSSSSRTHDNRKRARSQSPRSHLKNHIKERSAPRGGSSLLKRLVGSGSVGVKTPKELEEPKKVNNTSMEVSKSFVQDENSSENIKKLENQVNNESNQMIINEGVGKEVSESEKTSAEENVPEAELDNIVSVNDSFENLLLEDTIIEAEEPAVVMEEDPVKSVCNENDIPDKGMNCESTENTPTIVSDPSHVSDNRDEESIDKSDLNNEDDSIHMNDKKNDQDNDEDIDELNLRLEALRTAMLRKHKERQKRGFIRKKKTTLEDDSFAEYVLSNVDLDNSTVDVNEIEKSDKGLVLDSNAITYTSPGASSNITPHYNGSTEFPCYELNAPDLSDFNTARDVNKDYTCFINSRRSLSNSAFHNQTTNQSVAHCLKEINSNKENLIDSNKRVRRLSSKYKFRRSKGLESAKRRYGREVMERKLYRREFAEHKRLRKECIRDLKNIKTDHHVDVQLNEGGSDEECALRELALKSVKEKEKIKDNTDTSLIHTVADDLIFKNETEQVSGKDIFNNLSIDIDNNIDVKPLVSCDSESTPTNLSNNQWDDIDEDILRAQLLTSISLGINKEEDLNKNTTPILTKKQTKSLRVASNFENICEKKLKLVRQKINKENFKKISRNKIETAKRKGGILCSNSHFKKTSDKHEPGLNANSVPVVKKLIISLNNDSSTEEDDDSNSKDVVRSIDMFLQEVRNENDLKQGLASQELETSSSNSNQVKSDGVKQPVTEVKTIEKNSRDTNAGDASQIVSDKLVNVKHLPIWQQQEYHRLKKQIEEKERVIKTTKEKVLSTLEKEDSERDVKCQKSEEDKVNKNIEENNRTAKNKSIITNETDKISSNVNVKDGIVNKETSLQSSIKSPKHLIDSYKLVQEVNHMSKMIEYLEKEMTSFRDMYKTLVQKKKELLISKLNIAKKKKILFEIKKKLDSKEKFIQTKMEQSSFSPLITKIDPIDAKKQVSRDLELCKLRMREFNLRTKMIFDEIDHSGLTKLTKQIKGISPIEKLKLPLKSNHDRSILSQKMLTVPKLQATNFTEKTISKSKITSDKPSSVPEKQTETWDPFVPVCPFDLSGVCKDEECKFQHIKAA